MEEMLVQVYRRRSYGLLKSGVCLALEQVRPSLEMGDVRKLLIRVRWMNVRL